jgi:hypothetical protein
METQPAATGTDTETVGLTEAICIKAVGFLLAKNLKSQTLDTPPRRVGLILAKAPDLSTKWALDDLLDLGVNELLGSEEYRPRVEVMGGGSVNPDAGLSSGPEVGRKNATELAECLRQSPRLE